MLSQGQAWGLTKTGAGLASTRLSTTARMDGVVFDPSEAAWRRLVQGMWPHQDGRGLGFDDALDNGEVATILVGMRGRW